MFNAIKMEFYRFFRSKIWWILPLIMVGMVFLSVFSLRYEADSREKNSSESSDVAVQVDDGDEDESNDYMKDYYAGIDSFNESKKMDFNFVLGQGALNGNVLILMLTIFTVVFCCAEFRTGFIKNLIGRFNHRYYLVLSKLILALIYNIFLIFVSYAACLLFAKILFKDLVFSHAGKMFVTVLVYLLMTFALASVCILIIEMTRNVAASLAIGLAITLGVVSLLLTLLTVLINHLHIFSSTVNINKYMITHNLQSMEFPSANSDLIRFTIIGAVFLVVTITGSILFMNKKDVN